VPLRTGPRRALLDPGEEEDYAFPPVPHVRAYHDTTVEIVKNTMTTVALNSERGTDPYNMHDLVTNNHRLTMPETGRYFLWANNDWEEVSSNTRYSHIQTGDPTLIARLRTRGGSHCSRQQFSRIYPFTQDEYAYYQVFQNATTNIDLESTAQQGPEFAAVKLVGGIGAGAWHGSNQAAGAGVWGPTALNVSEWDTDGIHDPVTNNSRLTAQTAGFYLVIGNAEFQNDYWSSRYLGVRLNGTTFLAVHHQPAAYWDATTFSVPTIYYLGVGDYVELMNMETSGPGNPLVMSIGYATPAFMMEKLGNVGCRAYHNAQQAVQHNSWEPVELNSERWDWAAAPFHDTATNNSRMYAPYDGTYIITFSGHWAYVLTGLRRYQIRLGGSTVISQLDTTPAGYGYGALATQYEMTAGQYIEAWTYQSAGSQMNMLTNGNYGPELAMHLIHG